MRYPAVSRSIQVAGERAGAAGEIRDPRRPQLLRERLRDLAVEPGAWRVDIGEPLVRGLPSTMPGSAAAAACRRRAVPAALRRVPCGVAHRLSRELDPERSCTRSGPECGASRRARNRDRAHSRPRRRAGARRRPASASQMQRGQRLQEGRRAVYEPELVARHPGAPERGASRSAQRAAVRRTDADAATGPRSRSTPDRRAPRRATVAATSRALTINVACRPATCR